MHVKLLAHTPDPEKVIATAAKLCYSDSDVESLYDGLTPEKTEKFLDMLMSIGHESPIEHVSFTFGIEGGETDCFSIFTLIFSAKTVAEFLDVVKVYVPNAQIRG